MPVKGAGYAYVTPDELRIGLYVDLELGWMSHPFPKGSFKITSARQIETLRGMRLARVRIVPARSDPPPAADTVPEVAPVAEPAHAGQGDGAQDDASAPAEPVAEPQADPAAQQRQRMAAQLSHQRASLEHCDRQFDAAIQQYRKVIDCLTQDPPRAAVLSQDLMASLVSDMLGQSESSIRLLSESAGDRAWMHPVNVTVLSLLLGKALGMPADTLRDLGLAAFLHDVGKTRLPAQVRLADTGFAPGEYRQYQSHVALGLAIAQQLGLPAAVQETIAQHHEMMDGSGFPRQLRGAAMSQGGKVVALVNRYENMCNPVRASAAVTPHEALSLIFSQMKERHDITVLGAFIRMMGVYPPGSVVQLSDSRFALVVSVNSARPLKPRVIVHDPGISKEEALILDLEQAPTAGIRRSLRPELLPPDARDYLAPRQRICYFFERAADPVRGEIVP
jgi:putative nucleotidyltransferase with HDIG domain